MSVIDFVFAFQQQKVLGLFFFIKCNLHFFVAMSMKSFTLSIPKATSTLSFLITYFLLKHYTKQQKKSLSSSRLPARTHESARQETVAVPKESRLRAPEWQ